MLKKILLAVMTLAILGCGGSKATLENAKKLKEGMTETEITTLLGTPSKREISDMMGKQMGGLLYLDGPCKINIFIVDGKAAGATADDQTLFGKITKPK